jgi:hypothetical protein
MELDVGGTQPFAAIVAVVFFNIPILTTAWQLRKVEGLADALKEKDPSGSSTGDVSYSRVTGMIGAVVVGSMFWIISNIVIATAILHPSSVKDITSNISTIFLVGAALFLPYAFNQLKSLVQ